MDVIKATRKLRYTTLKFRRIAEKFLNHMHRTVPIISANGLYDLNLTLVPTVRNMCSVFEYSIQVDLIINTQFYFIQLIGTTLSYIVILNQFNAGDK